MSVGNQDANWPVLEHCVDYSSPAQLEHYGFHKNFYLKMLQYVKKNHPEGFLGFLIADNN